MEHPIAIANYFIKKSFEDGTELTPMKLLKLVYIAHGWHLGLTEEPLVGERVEAWKYGPVIPSVYNEYKSYGNRSISKLAYRFNEGGQFMSPLPDEATTPFLDEIWEVYKIYNGLQLSTLTHQTGTPWDTVWNRQGGRNIKGAEITNDLIAAHYKTKTGHVQA